MDLLFLDSAMPADIQLAASSGLVSGVTTNPSILRQAAPTTTPIVHLLSLFELFPDGPIFYQIHARDAASARTQVDELVTQLGDDAPRVIFKLPAQFEWFSFGARLVRQGHHVAFTAVYHPGQMIAAMQAGARYVIPYVDRARRLRPDSRDVVAQLSAVSRPGSPGILAASIKSAEQALEAFANGAEAITTTWEVIEALTTDELTDSAVNQFRTEVPL
ncbi:transaldolase family protein [Aeromicrobium sp.]|uniref:transaldolase family protein n=1 Tax=Aeromicrobium sp. TaxID=1871063 RepID=UPI0019967D11|nr:transaldolase family protein [Aeromicrobium sp.]MBC7633613.1 hypothetical protein [Aeromicrobium sp.]